MTMHLLLRELSLDAAAAEGELIPCTLATTTPVPRYGIAEVLDCSQAGVDLSRAPLPLIVAHDTGQLAVGVVEDVQARGDRVTGKVRFGTSPEAQQIRADVVAGIHRSLSVGYLLLDEGRQAGDTLVFRWQPYEVSIVSVPADHNAGFYRSLSRSNMPQTIPLQGQEAEEVLSLARRHNLPELGQRMVQQGATLDTVRSAILEELARRDLAAGGHLNVGNTHGASSRNERELIVNTLIARMGGRPQGDVIRSADLVGLAVRSLELGGHRVGTGESRDRIVERALSTRMHTTGDFPAMLGDAVGRVLHAFYDELPPALRAVARLANLPDFRARSVVRLQEAPSLEKVNEHGEFKYGSINEAANGWRLATYGRIIALTRQAIINDDLDGFAGLLQQFAAAAARREAEELTAMLVNPGNVDDAALFHASRSTLIDKALSSDGLGAAVLALRSQKEGGHLITQEPAHLVVPAALEMRARQLVAAYTPTAAGDVQPWRLQVVVEPRLDAASATVWYLVAGNQRALEYGYLDGAQGLQTMQREGFEVDGLEIKARLDFGCGWVAPVGWVKSSGTVA